MTELVEKYYNIMTRYRNGEFGSNHLTLYEIFEKAGEPGLLNRMTIYELEYIRDNCFGMFKEILNMLIEERKKLQSEDRVGQHFNVLATQNSQAVVVTKDGMDKLKNTRISPEVAQRTETMAEEFKNNLVRNSTPLKRTRKMTDTRKKGL